MSIWGGESGVDASISGCYSSAIVAVRMSKRTDTCEELKRGNTNTNTYATKIVLQYGTNVESLKIWRNYR